jgi:hypothetical protein
MGAMTASVMFAGLLAGISPPAVADGGPPLAAEDETTALMLARQSGRSVEIIAERTETNQVFAQPDGTQRLVLSARPTRVLRGSTWVDVQPNLIRRADGSVRPQAAALDLSFSGGGEGPLARIAKDGTTLSYTWPTPLPPPTLNGAVATYADVFPGVDLKLTADADGFSQVLVVRTAEAVARPELAELRIATSVSGGTLRMDESGNLTLISDGGDVVFHGNAPKMWDSSGSATEAGDRLAGPRTGDGIGDVASRLHDGVLVLTPDPKFLHDPGLTFPVHIDPPMHGASRLAFTYVSKHFAGQKFYGTSDVAKVGYYNDPNVPSGPTVDTYRSFFRMNTSPVNGKHIIKATFRSYEVHSWSCSPRPVELWSTGPIGTSTTWNAQPTWRREISSVNVAKGYGSACDEGGVDFDATSAVVEAASNKWPNLTLGLRAGNESDTYGWKKFRNNPTLEITYNTTPDVPIQLSADVGASIGVPCTSGPNRPYITTLTPTLRARVSDTDANKGQTVRAHFEWWMTNGAKIGESYTAYVASGTPVITPIPAGALTDGAEISWRVRAQDGVATSGSSDWSPWCEVAIDRTRPSGAPGVNSVEYPETPEGGDPVPGGGVGRMGTFTLTPPPRDTDIGGYLYGLNNDDPGTAISVPAGADGTATVKVTPSRDLLNALYVWSRDKAGNVGPFRRYEFSVLPGTSPIGRWKLDGTADDSSGSGHHGTVSKGVTWTSGRVDRAVSLNSNLTNSGIELQKPDAIVRTDANFSVAAWVRLGDTSTSHAVMSQDGVNRSGFSLHYDKGQDRWTLSMPAADSDGEVTYHVATSDRAPQVGVWTHLAGIFDAATGRMTLYVNGQAQAATAVQTTPWHANGTFAIGRGHGVASLWAGGIDDVQLWDRVLYRREIAELANRPAVLEGHWQLDEPSGGTAADSSGKGRVATASGGYSWSDGWIRGAASLTGTDGQLVTADPVLRTDRSFSVATWVRLTGADATRTAVSQDGAVRSAFYLQYDKTQNRWRFTMPTADANGDNYTGPISQNPAEPGTWTHLVGVYDQAAAEVKLYVDGTLQGATAFSTPWQAAGPLGIGRAKGWNRWAGEIDDVRAYTGVLTEDEIYDLAQQ